MLMWLQGQKRRESLRHLAQNKGQGMNELAAFLIDAVGFVALMIAGTVVLTCATGVLIELFGGKR